MVSTDTGTPNKRMKTTCDTTSTTCSRTPPSHCAASPNKRRKTEEGCYRAVASAPEDEARAFNALLQWLESSGASSSAAASEDKVLSRSSDESDLDCEPLSLFPTRYGPLLPEQEREHEGRVQEARQDEGTALEHRRSEDEEGIEYPTGDEPETAEQEDSEAANDVAQEESTQEVQSSFEVSINDGPWEASHCVLELLGIDVDSSSLADSHPAMGVKQLSLVSNLETSLPMSVLSTTLQRAANLTALNLFSISLEGNNQEFETFVQCLKQHTALEELHIVDCGLVDPTVSVDSLLRALAVIPTLHTVEIYAMDLERQTSPHLGVRWMNPTSLACLGSSKSITTLCLEDLDLPNEHIRALADSLKENTTLESLTLWDCNISDQGGQMIAEMLRVNHTVEKLDLSFNDFGDAALKAMGEALSFNQTVWSLALHGSNNLLPLSVQTQSQESSSKALLPPRADSDGYDALLHVLQENNHVLKEVVLETVEDPRVDLYVMINRYRHVFQNEAMGRRALVDFLGNHAQVVPSEEGVESRRGSLLQHPPTRRGCPNTNLSFIFCLLQANPELFIAA